MRRNVGGLFQMIHDVKSMVVGQQLLTMPQITQYYLEEYASMHEKIGADDKLLEKSHAALIRNKQRSAVQGWREDSLHIPQLREFMPQLREMAQASSEENATACIDAYEKALNAAQRDLRIAKPTGESEAQRRATAEERIYAIYKVQGLAARENPELAEQLEPHITAFTAAVRQRAALTAAVTTSSVIAAGF